jgi:acyl-CoA-binding protein
MTTEQLKKLVLFYKQAFKSSVDAEKPLMAEIKKVILELDKLKETSQDTTDTKEYFDELNYLLERLY